MKIVECVANISEGADLEKINAIAKSASGATILNIDSGVTAGRTVVTFVSSLEKMPEAAFSFIKAATELIDMEKHQGVHPCIGAADVIPFVPLLDTTLQECAKMAEIVARRIGEELKIPTFLYGQLSPQKNKLSTIRRGGFAALRKRVEAGEIIPDFGLNKVSSAGGVIIGARPLMLAYNINLVDDNLTIANEIASRIRTSGSIKRDEAGNIIYDINNYPQRNKGIFDNCEAIGWYIDDFKCAQISTNLRSLVNPPLHLVYETVKTLAQELNSKVTGSEIIGLLPLESLLRANKYYSNGADFELTIKQLGLRDVKPFSFKEHVLEERLKEFGFI